MSTPGGVVDERDRGGRVARLQRQPALPAHQRALQRAAHPVGARGPAPLVRRTAAAGRAHPRPAAVRPAGRPSVPRHRHGLRRRVPDRGCRSSSRFEPAFDTRLQVVDNVSFATGDHLFKAGLEYNRTGVEQQFIGFANGRYVFDSVDGFMGFVTQGNRFVTCSDGFVQRPSASARRGPAPPGRSFSTCSRRPSPASRPSSSACRRSRSTSWARSCRTPGIRTTA